MIVTYDYTNYTLGYSIHTKKRYSKVQEPFNQEDKSLVLQQEINLPSWFSNHLRHALESWRV